jgi:tripartite-type tricarboxylate transporter receptor subunit TctC
MVHVPYKGSAQATGDVVSGQIQAQFDQTVLPQIQSGHLRGLAILADSRWPYKPEIPTLREQGYGKEGGDAWYGILAPAGTPPAIVDKMSKAIGEALKSPDVIDRLDKAGAKATYLDSKAMRAQMAADNKMFADIIKRGNVTLQ